MDRLSNFIDLAALEGELRAAHAKALAADGATAPLQFTAAMRDTLILSTRVIARHIARQAAAAHDRTAARIGTTDELIADLDKRLAALERHG
ncbi:hypothetical protein [Piscinibacter sp.]|uniref:hypothetical protein n=1 Tax=Piscinibacter sp. TaxID=1903157 RepID=UPI002CCB2AC3|nr:hypothetical protein [Albitalea sp.]HUG21463.1 hypothetical protein [Albitalea sp.]